MINIKQLEAIYSLVPEANFLAIQTIPDDDNSWIIEWNDENQIQPTDEEVDAEATRLKAEYDAKQYQRDREYPSLEDQADMQYWDLVNGTTTWQDTIAAIKAAHPKPE